MFSVSVFLSFDPSISIFHFRCEWIELLSFYLPRQSRERVRFFPHTAAVSFSGQRGKKKSHETAAHLHHLRVAKFSFFFFAVQNFLIARLIPMAEVRGGHPICANGFLSNAFPSSPCPCVDPFAAILLWRKNWIHIATVHSRTWTCHARTCRTHATEFGGKINSLSCVCFFFLSSAVLSFLSRVLIF